MHIVQAKTYVSKSEISFNIMLNNHRNDVIKSTSQKQTNILN